IDPEHVFFAFVLNQDSPAGELLAQAGVTPQALQTGAQQAQAEQARQQAGDQKSSEESVLEQFGYDLTAEARDGRLDPVIGRADEIDQTIEILAHRTKKNPVLLWEADGGKAYTVEVIVQALVDEPVPA